MRAEGNLCLQAVIISTLDQPGLSTYLQSSSPRTLSYNKLPAGQRTVEVFYP